MKREVETLFPPAALEAVRAAVAEAERTTGGEVVTFVVGRSDDYPEAPWRAAAVGSLAAAAAAGIAHALDGFWGGWGVLWITLPAVGGAALGYALGAWVPDVKRWLVDPDVLARRVALRASRAFLDEEVFATRDRTGILLFLSLFEHRAVVLADSGIHARVEASAWEAVAADLAAGMRAGRAGEALVEAVRRCGELLAERGVPCWPEDRDELADRPRLRDD